MNMIYDQFIHSSLDLSALGLDDITAINQDRVAPGNARVLAWLTDSSVCFCQFPEQADTVYASDCSALPEEQLLPVAKNILDFIGLLVRCKDAALIARSYQWSSIRFRELSEATVAGIKTRSVIRALENTYHPPVIDDPGAMMAELRKEHLEAPEVRKAEWNVGFETDFSASDFKGKAGTELSLNKTVSRKEGTWHIPSIYLCNDGIVADTIVEVSADRIEEFRSIWGGRSEESLSQSDKLQRQLDDPLTAAVTGILTVNDKPLRCKKSFTAIWNPLGDNPTQVRQILNHYKLDPDCGYLFRRYCFLRKGKYPQIRTMQLTLEAVPVMVPEEGFTVQEAGGRFRFIHPSTGLEHIFTVTDLSQEALNPNFLTNHPCFYTRMTYSLEPSISPENFRIVDQKPSDFWEGYQDDPASVIYADRKPDPGRYALSSLHYEPQDQVCWQMIFRRKICKDLNLQLLP